MLKNALDIEIKNDFLKSLQCKYTPKTISVYESTLNKVGKFETMYGVSLCNANPDLKQAIIAECFGVRDYANQGILSRIKEYLEWCQQNGYTAYNPDDISYISSKSKGIQMKYFLSWDEFEDYLDTNLMPDQELRIDIAYRIYAELIFCGFDPRSVPYILQTDIDWEKHTITYMGLEVKPPIAVMQRIRFNNSIEKYNIDSGERGVMRQSRKLKSKYIIDTIKTTENRDSLYTYMVNFISKINRTYIYKHTSMLDIYVSGAMLRAYNQSGDPKAYLIDEYTRIYPKFTKSIQLTLSSIYDSWLSVKQDRTNW